MKLLPKRRLGFGTLACGFGFLFASGSSSFAQFPPGPHQNLPPIAERRAAVLKEHDKDGDGRLTGAEREGARQAWENQRRSGFRRNRGFFQPPPEMMEEFDKNKDGELDDAEEQVARETMGKRFEKMTKDYDANGNGRLDPEEIDAASKDIDAGKLKGIPKMFLQFARGGGPRGGRGRGPGGGGPGGGDGGDPADILRTADRDGDGRLSASEMEVVRSEWAKRKAAQSKEGGAK